MDWWIEQLSEFYEDAEARLWLNLPHPQLGDERPIAVIEAGYDQEVLALIEQLRTGAYV